MKKILLFFLVLLFSGSVFSQSRRSYRKPHYRSIYHKHYYHFSRSNSFSNGELEFDNWILYGSASQYVNNTFGISNAYGISAEYLFADNWSIRGGIYINTDYCHFTPAPLGIFYLRYLAADDNSTNSGRTVIASLISLAMNDGIGYNFPIGNRMHLMPYFGTWQPEFQFKGPDVPVVEKDLCSMGMSFKYQFAGNWLLAVDAEYNRTVWFKDSQWGYHLNFSLGYKID